MMPDTIEQAWDEALNEYSQRINRELCQNGLSVWEGTDHRLIYVECRHNTLDNLSIPRHSSSVHSNGEEDSRPSGRHAKIGGAGESQTSMFLQLALAGLSTKDQRFLQQYEGKTVAEVAAVYNISAHACYCRLSRLRSKLLRIARSLESR